MTPPAPRSVLLIEDDPSLRRLLSDQIGRFGYAAQGAGTLSAARDMLRDAAPDLMLVDMNLPDGDGFEALESFGETCPVIFLTAFAAVDQAVKAVHAGAADYLVKPISAQTLELALRKAFAAAEMERDLRFWQEQAGQRLDTPILGESDETAEMRKLIDLYARAESPVLIRGPGGAGKEMIARVLHSRSPRAEGRFLAMDCEAADETMLTSELFGHERGAFHGADERREGAVEIARGGALYLNDVAELSPTLQGRLLRLLEDEEFRRLGGAADLHADLRIIAATRRDLAKLVETGDFRSELYYRLSSFTIRVPSLRERPGDIRELARHFLETRSFAREATKTLPERTMRALLEHTWPGNVRELRNAIERGVILSGEATEILPSHLALPGMGGPQADVTLSYEAPPTLERIREDYLRLLLDRFHGNRAQVAEAMGISERNTYRLIRKLREEMQDETPG